MGSRCVHALRPLNCEDTDKCTLTINRLTFASDFGCVAETYNVIACNLYKVLEKLTHQRLNKWSSVPNKTFPNPQQSAYTRKIGPLTLSFNLQEPIATNHEYGSKTHVALLDITGAFDNVLHCALFTKLDGIRGKILSTIINCSLI